MNTVGDFGDHDTNWPACSNEVKRGRLITAYKPPLGDCCSVHASRMSVARRSPGTLFFPSLPHHLLGGTGRPTTPETG